MTQHAFPATLSVDLDDLWAYLRARGDATWTDCPSLLPVAVPRLLDTLGAVRRATLFVVGRDAECPDHRDTFAAVARHGHEIANHSYAHRTDFHRADRTAAADDIARAERAIEAATGQRPRGFRGPSFRLSRAIVETLIARDYLYDASTFPTVVGPLARAFHFRSAGLDAAARKRQQDLFGSVTDGLRPLKPYRWRTADGALLEIPVTTMPLLRVPIHMTYVNFLADTSATVATAYFRASLALCRARGVAPSLLLHATDVIGGDDADCPAFLPGMRRSAGEKVAFLEQMLELYGARFDVLPLDEYAEWVLSGERVPTRAPRFD